MKQVLFYKMKKNTTNIKKHVVEEIHRPARINFKRRRVILKGLKDLYQADLCELGPYATENNGFKYILVIINWFLKYLWALPLKTKTGKEVAEKLEIVFKESLPPKPFQTDQGTEFLLKNCQQLLKKYINKHYYTFSEKKASVVKRVIKTLKCITWKELNVNGSYKWYSWLPTIVKQYNNRKHMTIGMKPSAVTKKHGKQLPDTDFSHNKIAYKPKLVIM